MNAILDTGPWVALIDRSESKHDIITFDQKDFNIYRVKKQPFVIKP